MTFMTDLTAKWFKERDAEEIAMELTSNYPQPEKFEPYEKDAGDEYHEYLAREWRANLE